MNSVRSLKIAIACSSLLFSASSLAQHSGVGGGDSCDGKIKQIRSALTRWIQNGHGRDLTFKYGINYESYRTLMLEIMKPEAVTISCIKETPENNHIPIQVNGVPKTCLKFPADKQHPKPGIRCDYERFMSIEANTDADRLYVIHHEFASLKGIERSVKDESDYFVSDQIKTRSREILGESPAVVSNKKSVNALTGKIASKGVLHTTLAGAEAVGGSLLVRWGAILKDARVEAAALKLEGAAGALRQAKARYDGLNERYYPRAYSRFYQVKEKRELFEKHHRLFNAYSKNQAYQSWQAYSGLCDEQNLLLERMNRGYYTTTEAQLSAASQKISHSAVAYDESVLNLNNAKRAAIEAQGWKGKTIRGLKIVGGALLIVDALSRTYLWYATDAMPHLVATADLIKHISSN
jgi:hypothetical protein